MTFTLYLLRVSRTFYNVNLFLYSDFFFHVYLFKIYFYDNWLAFNVVIAAKCCVYVYAKGYRQVAVLCWRHAFELN